MFLTQRRAAFGRAAVFLAIAALGLAVAPPLRAQQFRAAWADVFHVGTSSTTEVNNMVSSLVAGHYNVVIVQVVGYMDSTSSSSHGAFWKSAILPWSTKVTAGFDPLAYLCQQAHASGIEVHAWLGGSGGGMYRVSTTWPPAGNTTLASNPQWMMVPLANSEGNAVVTLDGNYLLDMGSPEAQEYIVSIVRELVTNYPIDGINWDDEINSTGYNQGYGYPAYSQANYARSGLARYRINTGASGTPSNTDVNWSNYRRRFKNELMARCQAEIQSIKTNPRQPLRHTSAALAYSPAPSSCTFSSLVPYTYFCDWAGMLQNGWLDAVIPQTYSSSTFNTWADKSFSCWQYNRQIFPGVGAYLYSDSTDLSQLQYAYSIGLKGCATYSYAVANNSGTPGDWWAYVAANLYTTTVTTPVMPWRNTNTATEGIMWGRVSNGATGLYVDDATVAVSGGSTVKTDGNGYYVAALIPATAAGTVHSTTASKTGTVSQTIANATVLAGDVVRYDFVLNASPAITTQPASRTNNAGTTATFTVVASGSGLSYQWRKSGTALTNGGTVSGALTATLTLSSVASSDAASYTVLVSNTGGTVTSSAAVLTVILPPSITTPPQSQTVNAGSNPSFTVVAAGTAPLAYQWRFNAVTISGATATSYTIAGAQSTNAGSYTVVVTNTAGSVTSSAAVLTVINPPTITTQPSGLALAAGANASFSVLAGGTAPLSYQWQFNNATVSGATLSSYTRANVHTVDAGSYSVVVTNAAGSITSSNAVLTVNNPPTLSPVASLTVHAGAKVTVTNTATDSDLPAQTLTFTLDPGAPPDAAIGSGSGIFTWLTTDADTNTGNPVTVRVTDNGAPAQSTNTTFTISVTGKPVIQSAILGNNILTITWSAIAGDTYRVQTKDNVADSGWTDLISVTANGPTASCTNTVAPGGPPDQRFYRILLAQ